MLTLQNTFLEEEIALLGERPASQANPLGHPLLLYPKGKKPTDSFGDQHA